MGSTNMESLVSNNYYYLFSTSIKAYRREEDIATLILNPLAEILSLMIDSPCYKAEDSPSYQTNSTAVLRI